MKDQDLDTLRRLSIEVPDATARGRTILTEADRETSDENGIAALSSLLGHD